MWQVRGFITHVVLELQCDVSAMRTVAIQLGQRHQMYFEEGFQQAFWDSFCRSIHDGITELVTTYADSLVL